VSLPGPAQDALSAGMVALLADPVGQAQAVNNLASAAFAPALVGPLLLYALPALCLVRAAPLAEGAWGRAAGAALAPAQAAAYFFLQAAALMGVALGLPWASYTPALRSPPMATTGAALCSLGQLGHVQRRGAGGGGHGAAGGGGRAGAAGAAEHAGGSGVDAGRGQRARGAHPRAPAHCLAGVCAGRGAAGAGGGAAGRGAGVQWARARCWG
jgi:hypothetical protein